MVPARRFSPYRRPAGGRLSRHPLPDPPLVTVVIEMRADQHRMSLRFFQKTPSFIFLEPWVFCHQGMHKSKKLRIQTSMTAVNPQRATSIAHMFMLGNKPLIFRTHPLPETGRFSGLAVHPNCRIWGLRGASRRSRSRLSTNVTSTAPQVFVSFSALVS